MKKTFLFIGLGIGGVILVWWYTARGWDITNAPVTGSGPVIMFGDSLVEGVGATALETLPEQLGRQTGISIINLGVSGDTTRDGLLRVEAAAALRPRIAIVLLGGNDFLKKIPRAETFQNLEKIVRTFQAEGAVVMLLGVRSGIVGGGADEEYEALAQKTGSVYVSDVLSGVFGHPDLMSDALHPNDRGYAVIAKRLAPLVGRYVGEKK